MPKKAGTKNKNVAKVEVMLDDKIHIIEQREDGLHVRQKFSRDEPKVFSFQQIILQKPAPKPTNDEHTKLNGKTVELDFSTPEGKQAFSDELLCAAEDLKTVVRELMGNDASKLYPSTKYKLDAEHIRDTCEQVRKAWRLLRSVGIFNLEEQ